MLEHARLHEAEQARTDAEMRATPEEVALAAASLEARRAVHDQERAATLPLTEAIDHLGLSTTAEELWPEVEAIRAARNAQAEREARRQRARLVRRSSAAGAALGLALGLALMLLMGHLSVPHMVQAGPRLAIGKLSAVPDGTPVHMDSDALQDVSVHGLADDPSVDCRQDGGTASPANVFANEWKVVRRGPVLMVEAWATPDEALAVANEQPAEIYSSRPPWLAPSAVVPVEVPAYRVSTKDGVGNVIGYGPTGTTADTAWVLRGAWVQSPAAAGAALVEAALRDAKDVVRKDWDYQSYRYNVSAEGKDGVVRITGAVEDAARRRRASEVARETLRRVGIPLSVRNELQVGPE